MNLNPLETDIDKQLEKIRRGIEELISEEELVNKLKKNKRFEMSQDMINDPYCKYLQYVIKFRISITPYEVLIIEHVP